MKYLTTVPFSGFYESLHAMAVDDGLEQMFSDLGTGTRINYDLVYRAWGGLDSRQVFRAYAKEYCGNFAQEFGLDLEFDALNSPREYNFTTDRIFAYISKASLRRVFSEVDKGDLGDLVKESFTSRDGFISFYSPRLEEWPQHPQEWDHNQIGTLLQAFVGRDFDQHEEYSLMESSFGNGFIDNIISEHCGDLGRLLKVHEYLESRESRELETT